MEFGERLKMLRKQQGMTLEEVGNIVGVGKSTVRKWESGQIANMRRDKIALLAKALHVTPAYLMGWEEDELRTRSLPGNIIPMSEMPHNKVPLIGSVAAGEPIHCEEEYDVYIDAPDKADYALRIEGDSMTPNYLDGDVVYIRQQPDVDDGNVAIVLVDDSATMKHVYHIPNGLVLISDNPAYSPMQVTYLEHDMIRILGLVVGYTRMFR